MCPSLRTTWCAKLVYCLISIITIIACLEAIQTGARPFQLAQRPFQLDPRPSGFPSGPSYRASYPLHTYNCKRRTDGISPHSTGLRPLPGPLPCYHWSNYKENNKRNSWAGQGNRWPFDALWQLVWASTWPVWASTWPDWAISCSNHEPQVYSFKFQVAIWASSWPFKPHVDPFKHQVEPFKHQVGPSEHQVGPLEPPVSPLKPQISPYELPVDHYEPQVATRGSSWLIRAPS